MGVQWDRLCIMVLRYGMIKIVLCAVVWRAKGKKSTLAGFEPTRRNASRFRIYLLNHSDIVLVTFIEKNSICEVFTKSTIRYFALRSIVLLAVLGVS